jgi:hypothetical protein
VTNSGDQDSAPEKKGPGKGGGQTGGPERSGPEEAGAERSGPGQGRAEEGGAGQGGAGQGGAEQGGTEQGHAEQGHAEQGHAERLGPEEAGRESGDRERAGARRGGVTIDPGAASERTRLAWRRTGLAAAAVTLLVARPAVVPRAGPETWLIAAAGLVAWVALVAIGYRRVRGLRQGRPGRRAIPAYALIIVALSILGGLVVML